MTIPAKRLKRALKRKKMTQSDLATSIHVTLPDVAYWIISSVPSSRIKQIEGLIGLLHKGVSGFRSGTKIDGLIGALDEHKIPLKNKARRNLHKKPGIYFLCGRNEQPLYVGQSGNIYERIKNHSQKCWYKQGVKNVRCIEIGDENLRKEIESMLIYLFSPPFNKHHVQED